MSYEYFAASLPMLAFGAPPPMATAPSRIRCVVSLGSAVCMTRRILPDTAPRGKRLNRAAGSCILCRIRTTPEKPRR